MSYIFEVTISTLFSSMIRINPTDSLPKMSRLSLLLVLLFSILFSVSIAEQENVIIALVDFMSSLSPAGSQTDPNWGWNVTSDPCADKWIGVNCTSEGTVKKIVLDQLNFTGVLDAVSLCQASQSLLVLSLNGNNIAGDLPEEISGCKHLTHLYLNGNRFVGSLPASITQLISLRRLDISNNDFSGQLPNDMSKITDLLSFLGQNNQLTGEIPRFNFSNLENFDVSNNNLTGPIPNVKNKFTANSFLGNPLLCGEPLPNACSVSNKDKKSTKYLIFLGYIVLGLIIAIGIVTMLVKNRKSRNGKKTKKSNAVESMCSGGSSEMKTGRSEYSIPSAESGLASSSLVVLTSTPVVNGMKFEDLLRAPAELIERGKYGSLYKVVPEGGVPLVVKRIKDWKLPREDFKKIMIRIDQVKHPNVLPVIAYYCSKQEKLLVYEYQQNGSLFKLLHGSQNGKVFDWGSRLNVANNIAEALAFMHNELQIDRIAHGNIKSSNILLTDNVGPIISEYGLMLVENQGHAVLNEESNNSENKDYDTFKGDIYGFGVILLELLTGKLVKNNGLNLAKWVHSVVKEEWTGEVFDKILVRNGASEESMVKLLQVALKCIDQSPEFRPSMSEVVVMISSIKEEDDDEERSTSLTSSSQVESFDNIV